MGSETSCKKRRKAEFLLLCDSGNDTGTDGDSSIPVVLRIVLAIKSASYIDLSDKYPILDVKVQISRHLNRNI